MGIFRLNVFCAFAGEHVIDPKKLMDHKKEKTARIKKKVEKLCVILAAKLVGLDENRFYELTEL